MAEPSKDTDQSMEDILQSIKRIIADEETPAAPGSDVLELTELLAEDVSVAPQPAPIVPSMSIEEIMAAPVVDELPAPAPVVAPAAPAAPVAAAPVAPVAPVVAAPATPAEKLMSEATVAASAAALKSLSAAPAEVLSAPLAQSAVFRSGVTVEDLVVEALRPMLKEWLDSNLPSMVKTLVEKEIRRLTA